MKSEENRNRKLMIAVLACQIQDYMQAKELTNDIEAEHLKLLRLKALKKNMTGVEQRIAGTLTRGREAMVYLFDESKESDEYVFGFNFICSYIGIDSTRFRNAIRALRKENIQAVKARARS